MVYNTADPAIAAQHLRDDIRRQFRTENRFNDN